MKNLDTLKELLGQYQVIGQREIFRNTIYRHMGSNIEKLVRRAESLGMIRRSRLCRGAVVYEITL